MEAQSKSASILTVDDDEIILVALNETLSSEGYDLTACSSAIEALEKLREKSYDVIVSDQRMAEMTGLEFFEEAKKVQPNASRILITGVLTLKTVIDAVNKGEIYRFLAKPWIREELLATVKNAVQRSRLLAAHTKLQADTFKLNEQLAEKNRELSERIKELTRQKAELEEARGDLRASFDNSLELCYRIISAFHPMLGEEARAVAALCKRMIECGSLSEHEARTLQVAAQLQNIGLIGVSRETLSKARKRPAELTEPERKLLKNHTIYGQTLAWFIDKSEDIGRAIRASRERWDGKGSPDRLAGEAIPEPARKLAVAVYFVECALNKEDAIEAILRESGKAFEPEAVRLFMKATRMTVLPRKVREILFSELEEGMALAKGLYSPAGLLLIPEGHRLNASTLRKVREHNKIEPISQRLLVYK